MLDTVRRLGYLQIDPISTVAPPQHLVLFSRLGRAYDRAELDRLLWDERKLIEWSAFIWPAEDLPYVRARMRGVGNAARRWSRYLKENAASRRYVLRELDRRGRCSRARSRRTRAWTSTGTTGGARGRSG